MKKQPPGIVGPDGRPMYVVGGQAIGAEHLNAGLDWTREMDKALTKEHDRQGRHMRGYLAKAVFHGRMPYWGRSEDYPGEIHPDSCIYEHTQADWEGGGDLFSIKAVAEGEAIVTMAVPMPSANYTITTTNFPVMVFRGFIGGGHEPAWIYGTPISAWEFRLTAEGPQAFRQGRTGRIDFMAILHGM